MIQILSIQNHQSQPSFSQIFFFHTLESWEKSKVNYNLNIQGIFEAKKNSVYVIAENNQRIFLIGLGNELQNKTELQKIANEFSRSYGKQILETSTQIFLPEDFDKQILEEILKGLYLGTYSYPSNKEHVFWKPNFKIITNQFSDLEIVEIAEATDALCDGQFACMDWLNKPANFKTADLFSDYLKKLSEDLGWKHTVFNREQCKELGLGAYLSVNQGSSKDAAFTILEYKSENTDAKTVGLVGKSVLFDTGGISIKGSQNMHYMKSDMGGATAVLGTLISATKMKLPVHIIVVFPITDNAVSRDAYLPSDVFTAYNGKTIEVLNTDAEGRMTLADGLSYLQKNYKVDTIIDVATLTGSAVRMFGDTCGVLFSNNLDLQKKLIQSGDQTQQRVWPLPLWDIWSEEITSDVADLKNISLKPIGDSIVAAKFLENFIDGHTNWAHLDIAGVAFGNVKYAKEKAATGYGVQLLLNFLKISE